MLLETSCLRPRLLCPHPPKTHQSFSLIIVGLWGLLFIGGFQMRFLIYFPQSQADAAGTGAGRGKRTRASGAPSPTYQILLLFGLGVGFVSLLRRDRFRGPKLPIATRARGRPPLLQHPSKFLIGYCQCQVGGYLLSDLPPSFPGSREHSTCCQCCRHRSTYSWLIRLFLVGLSVRFQVPGL